MNQMSLLKLRLREQMNNQTDDMVGGEGITDFAEYKYRVGRIEGLALAERLLLDILELDEGFEDD